MEDGEQSNPKGSSSLIVMLHDVVTLKNLVSIASPCTVVKEHLKSFYVS